MNNVYKIEKPDEFFHIRRTFNSLTMLELSRTKYSEIFQYKHAIIAERVTGGYDLYLPSTDYSTICHKYLVVERPPSLVASNISEYLTYEDIFAFKNGCVWRFLLLHNFELELELEENIRCSLDKRLSELPAISVDEDTSASFKAGFETLYNSSYDDQHHLAVFTTEDKDYLITAQEHEVGLHSSGIEIDCLGLITKLSGGDGRFFKATYDKGEHWYHNQFRDRYIYGAIQPMNDNEYPSIYPAKDFSGYWKKDHDGFIVGLAFLSNSDSSCFLLILPCQAKEVQFLKKMNRVRSYDETYMKIPDTLWKITSANDEALFLLVSNNTYVTMSLEDFTS